MYKYVIIALFIFMAFGINSLVGWITTVACVLFILFYNLPFFYARKGDLSINEGNNEKALYMYNKAYKTGRSSASTNLTYGILLLKTGNADDAVTVFNLILMEQKKKKKVDLAVKAKLYRALAYYKIGLVSDAIEEAEEIFEKYKNTTSYGLLAYLKLATNAPVEETLKLCIQAYDFNSDDRDICDNLALAYIKNGEYEKAKELTDMMIEKFPSFTEAYYHAALIDYKLGNNSRAVELLEMLSNNCTRSYLTTISEDEIENLKNKLSGVS